MTDYLTLARFIVTAALVLFQLPVLGQISVLGSLADDRDVSPGEEYTGEITVRNDSDEAAQARVYQTDYRFYHDGTNYFDDPGSSSRSNASWIQFNPSLLTLEPGESASITYVVTVPQDTSGALGGSFWSMLMVEGIPKDSPESTLDNNEQPVFGIRQVTRYGVQIASHIRSEEQYEISIAAVELKMEPSGTPVLQLSFENVGNLLLVPETWIELYSHDGELARRIAGSQSRVYPGTSVGHRFDLSETPSGSYDALIVVDGGKDNIFGAQYKIDL